MAKQTINLGTPNGRNGDAIRDAFQKVNNNFTELYSNTDLSAVDQHILPATTETYDLGSPEKRWRSLYVSENTVYFGDKALSVNQEGGVEVDGVVIATPGGTSANADWNATSGVAQILNKPSIPADINDLTDTNGLLNQPDRLVNGENELVFGGEINPDALTWPDGSWQATAFVGDAQRLSDLSNVTVTSGSDGQTPQVWTFNTVGTLQTPALLPITFTAIMDDVHMIDAVGFVDNAWWSFEVTFQVNASGSVETIITNNTPWPSNPGYVSGYTFRFTQADHNIPGYTIDIALTDIQNPSMFMYTTNLAVTQPPSLPSTITAPDAIKLTADATSLIFGANGNITLPTYGNLPGDIQTGIIFGDGSTQTTAYNLDQYGNLEVINFVAAGGFTNYGGSVYIRASRPDADATLDFEFKENGQFKLPAGGDIVDSNGDSVLGSGSLTVGNGTSDSVENVTELLINGTITEIEPGVVGVTIAGGTSQPYLELTDTPFITQPVTLGTPVTATAEIRGQDALVEVVIGSGEGPFIESITVTTPGIGYVVGQRYRIWYWQVGGNSDEDIIDFEVGTVGPNGTLLTVVNAAFQGTFTATNIPGTYSNTSIEYRPSEFDEVDTGLTLTRGAYNGFFNSEAETFDTTSNASPIGTLWNADGWGTLVGFNTRTYSTFNDVWVGEAPPNELVMWDTINNKYYKFALNIWGIDNNEYSYTRTLITDPNYFKKTDGLQDGEIDNIKPQSEETLQLEIDYLNAEGEWELFRDQDAQLIAPETRPWDGLPSYLAYELIAGYTPPGGVLPQPSNLAPAALAASNAYTAWQEARAEAIGITRGDEQGIYNPYRESGWNSNNSPLGTLWNIDGWNDLTDIESRTYTNFYAAYGNGGLGNKVPGSKAIMYVSEINKYYAIDWISWTAGGNYGGFSYTRREIDLTKLDQGVRFADNTVQTTAYIPTNVISTAPGERRIENASGYKQVTVTEAVRGNSVTTTAVDDNTGNTWFVNIAWDAGLLLYYNGDIQITGFEISADNQTWYPANIGGYNTDVSFQITFDNNVGLPFAENDTVYYRIIQGGGSVVWWDKADLPGGSDNFRGAVIDYHAYTGDGTIIGTIHIVDDDGEEYITHTEVSSGSTDSINNDLWIVTTEGTIRYGRVDGEASTLKIHWTAKVFYGDELYD